MIDFEAAFILSAMVAFSVGMVVFAERERGHLWKECLILVSWLAGEAGLIALGVRLTG